MNRLGARPYLALVTSVGLPTLVASVVWAGPDIIRAEVLPQFAVLTAFVVLGELLPIRVPRRHDEITVSATFAFAVLLIVGPSAAIVSLAIASIVADLVSRKRAELVAFNAAQYSVALAAAGLTLGFLTGRSPLGEFTPQDVPAVFAAAAVYFLANNTLAATGQALMLRAKVGPYIARDFAFQSAMAGMLLGLAPVVVVVEDFSLWLLPLLALPLVAVFMSGRQAAVNEHQAMHDSLTGLPNRLLFHDRVNQAIRMAQRDGSSVAVMIMDLDRFKEINDTLGHHHGDLLLRRIGPAVRSVLRESDTVARLGGDEFAVLLPGQPPTRVPERVASKILGTLERPFVLDGLGIDVRASVGIACHPAHGDDVDTLIQRADVAMYWAKVGGNAWNTYSADQDQHSPERLALVGELRHAIDADELVLHYQPKIDLHTGKVTGVETLIRWQHPQHGFLQPNDFIPIAEQTGLIRGLTAYVLEHALRQCSIWQAAGIELTVAVNLSGRNLLDVRLPEEIEELLRRTRVAPECLQFEITESTLMADPVRATEILDRLSAMGVRLAIDDFGTGYSSLSHLKRLPVHEIKIDKSFVQNMKDDKDDAVIVQSTIDLGRKLGLDTVAEGVESEAILTELARLGCDFAQGFHTGRPISAEDLTEWLLRPAAVRPGGPVVART